MFRTSLELNYVKRPFRPLYGWTQATPKSAFLDPTWNRSVPIYPGMVVTKTSGNNYTLLGAVGTAADNIPAGFIAQFVGGYGIDELLEAGVNAIGVWVLSPDAEFEVLAPAFDVTQSWTDSGNGTPNFVSASYSGSNQGQLVPYGTSDSAGPVAKLIQVESSTSLIIAGLNVTDQLTTFEA